MGQRNPRNHQFGMVETTKSWDVYHPFSSCKHQIILLGFQLVLRISLAHPSRIPHFLLDFNWCRWDKSLEFTIHVYKT
jgi:hypothetical protein